MKSVFKNMFACSVLMLASVAAHATANLSLKQDVITGALTLDPWKNAYTNMPAKMASKDDDQADSSDGETMLA
jgi:hypothetical protein